MAKVKFATDWTSSANKTHKRGSTADIDGHDARSLISRGIVQAVASVAVESPKPTPKKEQ